MTSKFNADIGVMICVSIILSVGMWSDLSWVKYLTLICFSGFFGFVMAKSDIYG